MSGFSYAPYARVWDALLALHGYRRAVRRYIQRVALDLPPAPHMLDVGCGTGLMTEFITERYPDARVTAFDLDPGMLAVCRGKVARWAPARRARVEVVAADLFAFTSAQPFDLVVAGGVLEYLPLAAAARRLRTLVAPGGQLLIFAVRASWFTRQALGRWFRFQPYPLAAYRAALGAAGFDRVRTVPFTWSEFPANLWKDVILASVSRDITSRTGRPAGAEV